MDEQNTQPVDEVAFDSDDAIELQADLGRMKRQNYICIMTMTEVQVSILLITSRRKMW